MSKPIKFYPIIDNVGLIRSMSMIFQNETYTCFKLCEQVSRATSEALCEENNDWSDAPPEAMRAELARRHKLAPVKPPATAAYKVVDSDGKLLAVILSYQGKEDECAGIANQVAIRVGAFIKEQCAPHLIGIQEAVETLHLISRTV